jgi:hypothetical protein
LGNVILQIGSAVGLSKKKMKWLKELDAPVY